jgi:hypothetical protein
MLNTQEHIIKTKSGISYAKAKTHHSLTKDIHSKQGGKCITQLQQYHRHALHVVSI